MERKTLNRALIHLNELILEYSHEEVALFEAGKIEAALKVQGLKDEALKVWRDGMDKLNSI